MFVRKFIGRCESCGDAIYDDDNSYSVNLGGATLTLCDRCCKPLHVRSIEMCELRNKDKCSEYCDGFDPSRECYRVE